MLLTQNSVTDEVISQSEIEKLLAQVGSMDAAAGADGEPKAPALPRAEDLQRHSFPHYSLISAVELRKLRVRHEQFIRSLAAQLSVYLRMDFGLQMSKLETVSFQRFLDSVANPTHLASFKLEPLRGTSLLEIPPKLGLALVDRQLGGVGRCVGDSRELSEIEIRLVSRVVDIVLAEWCNFWSSVLDLRAVMGPHENNTRSVQCCPPETTMLVLGMEARIGDLVEEMQLAFPCFGLEQLILKLSAQGDDDENTQRRGPTGPVAWNPALGEMKIRVTAELSRIPFSTHRLSALRPGDFLPLSLEMMDRVEVRLGSKAKFLGTFGVAGERKAARINAVFAE